MTRKEKVTRVIDGDTFETNRRKHPVRLANVDTPEKRQDFGQKAKQFTSNMVFNKKVKVMPIDVDRYKRIVGMV